MQTHSFCASGSGVVRCCCPWRKKADCDSPIFEAVNFRRLSYWIVLASLEGAGRGRPSARRSCVSFSCLWGVLAPQAAEDDKVTVRWSGKPFSCWRKSSKMSGFEIHAGRRMGCLAPGKEFQLKVIWLDVKSDICGAEILSQCSISS